MSGNGRRMRNVATLGLALALAAACVGLASTSGGTSTAKPATPDSIGRVVMTDAEWKKTLTAGQYRILRGKGTEIACTGGLWKEDRAGTYACAGCGLLLFTSKAKFDSKSGWPSFYQPISLARLRIERDFSHDMMRDEVMCARCDGHLGHVFDDGPKPTGLRYCINSEALAFTPRAR